MTLLSVSDRMTRISSQSATRCRRGSHTWTRALRQRMGWRRDCGKTKQEPGMAQRRDASTGGATHLSGFDRGRVPDGGGRILDRQRFFQADLYLGRVFGVHGSQPHRAKDTGTVGGRRTARAVLFCAGDAHGYFLVCGGGFRSAKKANDRFMFKRLDLPNETALKLAADAFVVKPEKATEWTQERDELWHSVNGVAENYMVVNKAGIDAADLEGSCRYIRWRCSC